MALEKQTSNYIAIKLMELLKLQIGYATATSSGHHHRKSSSAQHHRKCAMNYQTMLPIPKGDEVLRRIHSDDKSHGCVACNWIFAILSPLG
ncbi:Auxin efflux carrier component [Psidium guajava]|nr:Auxin efflux carrier component [Psidium guajava]